MLKFKISSCRGSEFTPVSNLTYLSIQDNFSLMPYCSLEPQECEKNPYVRYVKCIVSIATNNSIHGWGVPTKAITSQLLLKLDY